MTSITYRFPPVSHTSHRTVTCRTCGKKFRRQRTFTQTVSPFNRNEFGVPRTTAEVRQAVRQEAAEWQPEQVCTACKGEEA